MKKFTLIMLSVLMISVANAQFSAGEKYLGGAVSLNYTDNDLSSSMGQRTFGISLSPSIMKFKTDKKATGVRIMLGFTDTKNQSGSSIQKQNAYNAGLGVFGFNAYSIGKGFFLSLEKGVNGSVSWNNTKDNQTPPNKTKQNNYGVGAYLSPGIGYKLTDRLVLGLNLNSIVALNYTHSQTTYTSSTGVVTKDKSDGVSLYSSLNNTTLGQIGVTFAWKLK